MGLFLSSSWLIGRLEVLFHPKVLNDGVGQG